ncbi:hypothetical protein EIP91_011908 [Steccherinum ochraceum]|uniref:Uncharacterized protein n=1 Tax=Steccherinum ochraceum TaxID=92696 RepID=A0A4R0RK10_9APHY|nr:hypothetical protein EIP91_011908 [Steccherinum ochraceum]
MSIPSEYQQTHNELQNAINNPPNLSDSQKKEALDKIATTVTTPVSEGELMAEIDALANAALEVDSSFDHISALFNKVKLSGVRPELVKDVNDLTNTWSTHHRTFTALVWKSREVAGTAQAAADDFAKDFITFLADDDVTLTEKKDEIKNYMEKLVRDEKAAEGMSQGFTDLKKNVDGFQTEWQRIIDKYKLDVIAKKIADLDKVIADLHVTLSDLNIRNLAIALGVVGAATGISFALGFICPAFWIGTLFGVVGVGVTAVLLKKAVAERDDVEGQITRKEKERAVEQATLAAVKELKAGLDASQGDFNVICTRLGTFAKIWATIRADLQAIEEKLDFAHGTESKALFKSRLNTAAKLYAQLGKALRRYQVVVNKGDVLAQRLDRF